MAVTQDQVTAQEESLRARLHLSGDSLDVDGIGSRAVRPPAPSRLLLEGRKVRTRRRLAAGSFATAASVVVAGAGAGVVSGAWQPPWLRGDGSASPSTLYASRGTAVGDFVNAIDTGFGRFAGPAGDRYLYPYRYRSGPNTPGDSPRGADTETQWRELMRDYGLDRVLGVERSRGTGGADTEITFRLGRTRPGTDQEVSSQDLGALTLGDDGRGQWMRVRPSAEDGWLVLAVLPDLAGQVQVRVAGTDVVLPGEEAFDLVCPTTDEPAPGELAGGPCKSVSPGPLVRMRIATTDPAPPIEAITYIDKSGRYVVLGSEALVR